LGLFKLKIIQDTPEKVQELYLVKMAVQAAMILQATMENDRRHLRVRKGANFARPTIGHRANNMATMDHLAQQRHRQQQPPRKRTLIERQQRHRQTTMSNDSHMTGSTAANDFTPTQAESVPLKR
jgi:hypothetical protein